MRGMTLSSSRTAWRSEHLPLWSLGGPLLGLLALAAVFGLPESWRTSLALPVGVMLVLAVMTAVHHAEVVAHRVGEPMGTLVLAVAVTVIEVALIVSLMLAGGESSSGLARDTVFAAVMIVSNGVVGLCVVVGSLRHRVVSFRTEGTASALATLVALSGLTLVLPAFTRSSPGPTYTPSQLVFAGVVSLVLYAVFVFVQTVRHREDFLPVPALAQARLSDADEAADAAASQQPDGLSSLIALALLVVCLVVVVGLAKALAPLIESGVAAVGFPHAFVGVIVALLVLLPETWAAVKAAARARLQNSLNLALGSALASIGLTIPTVAALSFFLPYPLALGLGSLELVLLLLTFIVGVLTLGTGRATVLHGAVHLVLFAVFLFLAAVP